LKSTETISAPSVFFSTRPTFQQFRLVEEH